MRRRLLVGAAVVVLAVAGAAVGWYLHVKHQERDVRGSPTVEFVPKPPPPPPKLPGIAWPMYGRDQDRLHVATGVSLAPPFRRAWTFRARSLVEFPPAIAYGRLYFANNDGVVYAVEAKTGKRVWSYDSHRCQAMSPAVSAQLVFATFLNRPPCNASSGDGRLVAFAAKTGKVRWQARIGPSESSPLVHGKVVYVGDWNGAVSAYAAKTGRRLWTFHAGGKVKDGLAYAGGRVFFGAYDSHVYAVDAHNGKLVWRAAAQPRFGHSGTFYATPAVAYGRVYIGATDGKMYSFGAASGALRWSQSTGGYVYSSAAIWRKRVFAGSYDGTFYAFDAATGDVKWTFRANGPISGSPTVLAGRVYFSTLKSRTYALNGITGRLLWSYPDGKYSPVVADDSMVYLVGYTRVYGLVQRRRGSGCTLPRCGTPSRGRPGSSARTSPKRSPKPATKSSGSTASPTTTTRS
jgi:outer membrane protein assembly factor BamB